MNVKLIGCVAAATALSGGLVIAGVLPATTANATTSAKYGWVKVCQYIHNYDHDENYNNGKYSIKNDYGTWGIYIDGDKDDYLCYKKKVRTGWTKVTVHDYPDNVKYDGKHDSYKFEVKKDRTYTVTYHYTSR